MLRGRTKPLREMPSSNQIQILPVSINLSLLAGYSIIRKKLHGIY
jgi:hypothetical protein